MSIKLNTENYLKLNNDMTALFQTGLYAGVSITMYTDEACTNVLVYNNIPINNKKITKVSKTNAYTDKITNEHIKAHIDVFFDDNTWSVCTDEIDDVWYVLAGIPVHRRRF